MLKKRLIPVLLVADGGLVKGVNFKNHIYIGDPINAVKLFNDKEVDELIFLDIFATKNKTDPDYKMIQDISSEAFMPVGYGGGVNSMRHVESLFKIGIEKVVINSAAFFQPQFVREISDSVGTQSVVISIDVKKSIFGKYEVFVENGTTCTRMVPVDYAKKMEQLGAGEIIVCSIGNEGVGRGYDLRLLGDIAAAVSIPVVGLGGAGNLEHVSALINATNISAAAAGDMFVFHGKHKGVLISYPSYDELQNALGG